MYQGPSRQRTTSAAVTACLVILAAALAGCVTLPSTPGPGEEQPDGPVPVCEVHNHPLKWTVVPTFQGMSSWNGDILRRFPHATREVDAFHNGPDYAWVWVCSECDRLLSEEVAAEQRGRPMSSSPTAPAYYHR
jgi:hypothetical protein